MTRYLILLLTLCPGCDGCQQWLADLGKPPRIKCEAVCCEDIMLVPIAGAGVIPASGTSAAARGGGGFGALVPLLGAAGGGLAALGGRSGGGVGFDGLQRQQDAGMVRSADDPSPSSPLQTSVDLPGGTGGRGGL